MKLMLMRAAYLDEELLKVVLGNRQDDTPCHGGHSRRSLGVSQQGDFTKVLA